MLDLVTETGYWGGWGVAGTVGLVGGLIGRLKGGCYDGLGDIKGHWGMQGQLEFQRLSCRVAPGTAPGATRIQDQGLSKIVFSVLPSFQLTHSHSRNSTGAAAYAYRESDSQQRIGLVPLCGSKAGSACRKADSNSGSVCLFPSRPWHRCHLHPSMPVPAGLPAAMINRIPSPCP